MAIKTRPRHIVLAVLFIMASAPFLKAQTAGYFTEFRIAQRLTWTGDEYTRRYEIVIEKEEDNEYRQVRTESTDATFIVVSLEPGKYRYRIIPYNFLNRPGESSDWVNIEVRAVLDPELNNFSPVLFYLSPETIHELSVFAANLTPDTVLFLRRFGGATIFPIDIKINEDGSYARLFFDNNQLTVGDYEIIVRNPGWLETSMEGFTISYPIQPELDKYSPSIFYKDAVETHELVISGNLLPDAEIFLRRYDGVSIVPVEKYIHEDGSNARAFFDNSQLISGNYDVVVRNPGKLEAHKSGFTIIELEREKERARLKRLAEFWSVGVSAGTSFTAPVIIGTVHGTIAPFRYSFLEVGFDMGLVSGIEDAKYFSLYPFVHYAFFLPFAQKGGWFAGAGGGWYWAHYAFPEGDASYKSFAIDLATGVNILNMFNISYTIRANKFSNVKDFINPKNLNSKLSVGYVYRFKTRSKDAE